LSELKERFRIVHPFHPLFNGEYRLLEFRRNWGREYVAFYDPNEKLATVPIVWTDLVEEEDPFTALSGGQAYFRPEDLLDLADLVEGIEP
jgi:hypothetical protein